MSEFTGVRAPLAQALTARGYTDLTPVQKAVIGLEPAGADALVSAQTGSGKTVAFGLALAPTLLGDEDKFGPASRPLALAIAPTRELAIQVKRELDWLYANTGASVASCVGGMDMRTEKRTLERGAHIVVGTPGRLRDHIMRHSLDMSDLRAVVLDEADEMLDLGFRDDLEFILGSAPKDRRTLMFSATVSRPIADLAKSYQRDAIRVTTIADREQHLDIEYRALTVASGDRENAIINVLRYYEAKNALVFCSTRAAVNHMTARFNNRGFSVVAMSGELSQNERTHALQAMRDGRARVCIATDVAARGIDLPGLELVIHADLPTNRETLLHRSGRTGRAGNKGVSVLIVPQSGRRRVERLLSSANVNADWARPPSADDVLRRDDERILADPVLSEALQDDERAFVAQLIETHGAEQVAAAYVRTLRNSRSAPEDLISINVTARPDDRDRGPRAEFSSPRPEFGASKWVALSVGRAQNAEPRWLIPMLCKAGGLHKRDIGHIKLQQDQSFVELDAASAEQFLSKFQGRTLERGIRVTPVEGTPEFADSGRSSDGPRERFPAKKPHRGQPAKPGAEGADWKKPKRKFGDDFARPAAAPAKPWAKKEGRDRGPAPQKAYKPKSA